MAEFNVSLRKPNKRFQIKRSDREERVYQYVRNVWTARKFVIDNLSVHPPVINGDQMRLYKNESASQKTLNIQGYKPTSKKTTPCKRTTNSFYSSLECFQNSSLKAKEHVPNFKRLLV